MKRQLAKKTAEGTFANFGTLRETFIALPGFSQSRKVRKSLRLSRCFRSLFFGCGRRLRWESVVDQWLSSITSGIGFMELFCPQSMDNLY